MGRPKLLTRSGFYRKALPTIIIHIQIMSSTTDLPPFCKPDKDASFLRNGTTAVELPARGDPCSSIFVNIPQNPEDKSCFGQLLTLPIIFFGDSNPAQSQPKHR